MTIQNASLTKVAIATLMALGPLVHAAQAPRSSVPAPGIYPYITAQAGNYDIKTEDVTELLTSVLDRAAIRQDVDRQYLQSSTLEIQKNYEELVQIVTAGELLEMSQKSISGESIPAMEFFAVINKVNAAFNNFAGKMTALTAVNPQTLPSSVTLDDGKAKQTLQNYGKIDFSPIVETFKGRAEELHRQASNYLMKVQFPKSNIPEVIAVNSGTTLSPKFNQQPLFTAAEQTKLTKDMNDKRAVPPESDLWKASLNYAEQLKSLMTVFVQRYGRDERFRNRDDREILKTQGRGNKVKIQGVSIDDYYTSRDQAFQKIVEAFWQRSYLRAKYGIRLCAIQPLKYQQRWGGLDKISVMTEAMDGYRDGAACSDPDLQEAAVNIRLALKVLDERSTNIVGDGSSPNLLVKANSFMSFVGGYRPTAETLFMVMQLVAGDIREEQLLASAGGLQKLREFYQGRYQYSPAVKAQFQKLKCAVDSEFEHSEQCTSNDAFAQDVKSNAGDGLKPAFNNLDGYLRAKTEDIEEANRMEEQLRIATASTKAFVNAKKRADDL